MKYVPAITVDVYKRQVFEDSLATLLNNYKEDVKVNYIFAAPNTAAAYFAPVSYTHLNLVVTFMVLIS